MFNILTLNVIRVGCHENRPKWIMMKNKTNFKNTRKSQDIWFEKLIQLCFVLPVETREFSGFKVKGMINIYQNSQV